MLKHTLQYVGSLGRNIGGPSRSVSQLSQYLTDQSIEVTLSFGFWPDDPIVKVSPNIRLLPVDGLNYRIGDVRLAKSFLRVLNRDSSKRPYNVVHMHGIWLNSSREVASFAKRKNIPLVVSPRGMLQPWAMKRNAWKKKAIWWAYQKRDLQQARGFHATAYSEAESIRKNGFNQPIAIIPNGVELPSGDYSKKSGVPDNSQMNTALFLSRIHPKKGLLMLVEAWNRVRPENWRLLIAGNDDSNHLVEVRRRIKNHGLSTSIIIVGPLFDKDKEMAFRNADLFILPSHSENFGIVVAEALSYRIPVLTTKGCPWGELETERCGWWVDANIESLVTGLKIAFKTDQNELLAMGERGFHLVERKYQWPSIASNMLAFYNWLLEKGDKPDFVI